MAVAGALLTLLVPEPAGRSLEDLSSEEVVLAAEAVVGRSPAPVAAVDRAAS
jgi:hypothetical protein